MRAALWARNSYFNPRRNRDAEKLTCPKARRTTAWTCFDFRAVLHTLRCLPLSEGAGKSLEDMLPTTHKTSRAVRRGRLGKKWDGRSSAPSTWTPSPPGQLIWSPGTQDPQFQRCTDGDGPGAAKAIAEEGDPEGESRGCLGLSPLPASGRGQDSISHWNNHGNTWISLRIFLKQYFYLFTEVIHIHYNKLGKHINRKKKISHLEYPYQAGPHLPVRCINLFCFM